MNWIFQLSRVALTLVLVHRIAVPHKSISFRRKSCSIFSHVMRQFVGTLMRHKQKPTNQRSHTKKVTVAELRSAGWTAVVSWSLSSHLQRMTVLNCIFCVDLELITLDFPSLFEGLNPETLVAAFENVLSSHSNIRLVILGQLANLSCRYSIIYSSYYY